MWRKLKIKAKIYVYIFYMLKSWNDLLAKLWIDMMNYESEINAMTECLNKFRIILIPPWK